MELSVYKIDGTESGKKVVLDENVFGIEPNDHVIYLDVLQYMRNQRQGTSKTKDRSEVAYSTKKLGRQKGGGGARHGSLKANIFVGGGRVFGPKPRTYESKLNKKVKSLARCSALSYKAAEGKITLVEPFTMFVLPENSNNIFLSSRNLPDVKVITVDEINTYAIMDAHSLVMVDGVQDILAARVK